MAVASLVVVGLALPAVARAAFEWEHPAPRSLIGGDSPARWPIAGEGTGLRADAVLAHPWSWPQVSAAALRIGWARPGWAAGLALSQLRGPAYIESRFAAGIEQAVDAHRFAVIGSLLGVAAGEPPRVGARSGVEMDLGWRLEAGSLALAARAEGALQSRGARKLAPPRRLRLHLSGGGSLLECQLELEEGSAGRRLGIGLRARPLAPLTVGAAWSSAEPPIRFLAGVSRGSMSLSAGWILHPTLPASHVLALSYTPGSPATPP